MKKGTMYAVRLCTMLLVFIVIFSGYVLSERVKIISTRICDGIAYCFVQGVDGVIVGRRFEPYEGEIVIPATVEIDSKRHTVVGILPNAFCCSPYLESVDVRCAIKFLNNNQFYRCFNLKSVRLPDAVQSIGSYAFFHCQRLRDLKIPSGVKKIHDGAFSCCYQLENVDLPPDLEYLGSNTFEKCYNLKQICIPEKVEKIKKETFLDCVDLQEVVFSDGVNVIGKKAFYNCQSLQSPTFPYGLQHIKDKAFQNCFCIEELLFAPGLKAIDWDAFSDCINLRKLTFLGETPPSMGSDAFYYRRSPDKKTIKVSTPDSSEKKYKSALRWKMHDCRVIVAGFDE